MTQQETIRILHQVDDRAGGGDPKPVPPFALPNKDIETLGVWRERPKFIDYANRYNRFIFVAPPGEGKSIGTPPMLMDAYDQGIITKPIMPGRGKVSIVETQPRRAAAGGVTDGITHFIGGEVGEVVGLRYKNMNLVSDKTRILVEVEGSLMNELKNDPLLRNFDVVIPDEIHEVGANLIVTLALLKRADDLRAEAKLPPLTIIPTSGTPNSAAYAQYFKRDSKGQPLGIEVPILNLERKQEKDIEYHWWKNEKDPTQKVPSYEELPTLAADILTKEIIGTNKSGDVLIVTPGRGEQADTIQAIKDAFTKAKLDINQIQIIPFDRSTPTHVRKQKIENIEDPAKRRVIVATSIANTSLSIKRMENVINMGYQKLPNIDSRTGIIVHDAQLSSKSTNTQIENRAGRGKNEKARVWHLFTKESATGPDRPEHDVSGIKRVDLAQIVLYLKNMDIDINKIDLLEHPESQQIEDALTTLKMIGALKESGEISDIGKEMANIQVDPHLARMVVEARKENIGELASVVAAMRESYRDLFYGDRKEVEQILTFLRAKKDDVQKQMWLKNMHINPDILDTSEGSDFAMTINIWNVYQAIKKDTTMTAEDKKKWYEDMHLNPETLQDIEGDVKDINNNREVGEIKLTDDMKLKLKKSLLEGFTDRILEGTYGSYIWHRKPETGNIKVSPGSHLHHNNNRDKYYIYPKYIISGELGLSKRSGTVIANFNEGIPLDEELFELARTKVEAQKAEHKKALVTQTETTSKVTPPSVPPRPPVSPIPQPGNAEIDQLVREETEKLGKKPKENIIRRIIDAIRQFFSKFSQ